MHNLVQVASSPTKKNWTSCQTFYRPLTPAPTPRAAKHNADLDLVLYGSPDQAVCDQLWTLLKEAAGPFP